VGKGAKFNVIYSMEPVNSTRNEIASFLEIASFSEYCAKKIKIITDRVLADIFHEL